MCEIFFMQKLQGTLSSQDISDLLDPIDISIEHNKDGIGFFNEKIDFKKKEFADEDEKIIKEMFTNSKFLVAHTRYATLGEVSTENAHPFSNERFVWVHNGTLDRDFKLEGFTHKVDSELIGEIIRRSVENGKSTVEAIKEFTQTIHGWYSVFLLDKQENKLYYFRSGAKFAFGLVRHGKDIYLMGATDFEKIKRHMFVRYLAGISLIDSFILGINEAQSNIIYEITEKGITLLDEFEPKKLLPQSRRTTQAGVTGKTENGTKQTQVTEWDEELEEVSQYLEMLIDTQIIVTSGEKRVYIESDKQEKIVGVFKECDQDIFVRGDYDTQRPEGKKLWFYRKDLNSVIQDLKWLAHYYYPENFTEEFVDDDGYAYTGEAAKFLKGFKGDGSCSVCKKFTENACFICDSCIEQGLDEEAWRQEGM